MIVDPESCVPCPPGRIGEIWVQGPSVAQGYWQDPEATERIFHARLRAPAAMPLRSTASGETTAIAAFGRDRRRRVFEDRRLGVSPGRRIVCHRPAEGPDHCPRRELLSPGHRTDRAAEPSPPAPRLRRRVRGRPGSVPPAAPGRPRCEAAGPADGSPAGSNWSSFRKSNGTSRETFAACLMPSAAAGGRARAGARRDRADPLGQRAEDF